MSTSGITGASFRFMLGATVLCFSGYALLLPVVPLWAERGGFSSPNKNVSEDIYPDEITKRSATSGEDDAGPIVPTIFVRRSPEVTPSR